MSKTTHLDNLCQIITAYSSTQIADTHFLFHIERAEVSVLHGSAKLFIELAEAGLSNDEIITEVHEHTAVSRAEIEKDLTGLCRQLLDVQQQTAPDAEQTELPIEDFQAKNGVSIDSIMHHYHVASTDFSVTYPSPEIAKQCHAILSSISCPTGSDASLCIDIQLGENGLLLNVDGAPAHFIPDSAQVADYLRSAMLNRIGENLGNWLGIHAAAIADRSDTAVLFAAPSGSGKSTLCLELCLNGYEYLGDDMQILDLDQKRLLPFPTSANLKSGSWPLFESRCPQLADIEISNPDRRPVKYLPMPPPAAGNGSHIDSISVKAIIFPEFDPAHENNSEHRGRFKKIDLQELVDLLTASGCYSGKVASVEMSRKYIEFFVSLDAYQMQYSSSEQAIQLLREHQILSR